MNYNSRIFLQVSVVFAVLGVDLSISAQPAWVDNDLVAYYQFDGNAENQVGAEHHGVELNGRRYGTDRFDAEDSAFSLSSGQHIKYPGLEPFGPTPQKSMSISFWTTRSFEGWILTQYAEPPANNNFFVQLKDGNWNITGNGSNSYKHGENLPDDTWHHWAVTFAAGGFTRIYLNGSQVGEDQLNFTSIPQGAEARHETP